MEMRILRENLFLLGSLIVAGVIFSLYACPYLRDRNHPGVCIAVYAVLVLIFVYGRAVTVKRRPKPPRARSG